MVRALYGCITLFVLAAGTTHAGFDFGPVGNALFWFGLMLWSAGVSWLFYLRRNTLGKRIFSVLRTLFAPHKKTHIVVSAPKYRPYVETSHAIDSLERAAESFLTAAKTGMNSAQSVTREALSVLERDRHVALTAVNKQRAYMNRKGTSLSDRVKNIQKMILGKGIVGPKKVTHRTHSSEVRAAQNIVSSIPKNDSHVEHAPQQSDTAHARTEQHSPDSSYTETTQRAHTSVSAHPVVDMHIQQTAPHHADVMHTREKVKVLSDAHRALIRARNAQHDLPQGGVYREDVPTRSQPHTPQPVTPHTQTPINAPRHAEHDNSVSAVRTDSFVHSAPKQAPTQQTSKRQETEQPIVQRTPSAHAQVQPTTIEQQVSAATRDELVLDTSGPIPKLVLTRKHK